MFWNTTKIQTVYEWIFFYVKTTPYLRENNPAPYLRDRKTCVRDGVNNVLLWCEYIVAMAPSAYQGRIVMPTGPLSRVDAWGGAWKAV